MTIDHQRRFGGLARLYGPDALQRFTQAHVCVIGIGGVGSWTAEALARSAIGHLTLIDMDHIAESNINRQVHALETTLGQAKVLAMQERIGQINPRCTVNMIDEFVTLDNLPSLFGDRRFDYVIDATDQVAAKVALIVYCQQHNLPIITIGAAGGKSDPTRIRINDLARTEQEPLLAKVRKRLRSEQGFSRNLKTKFAIPAVFSEEPLAFPEQTCITENLHPETSASMGLSGLNCAGYGSSVAVTATFGFIAAGYVLRQL